jgi:hypothetical protein
MGQGICMRQATWVKLAVELTVLTAFHCHLHCLPQLHCHALPHDSGAAVAYG